MGFFGVWKWRVGGRQLGDVAAQRRRPRPRLLLQGSLTPPTTTPLKPARAAPPSALAPSRASPPSPSLSLQPPSSSQVLALQDDVDEDHRPVALVGAARVRRVGVAPRLDWWLLVLGVWGVRKVAFWGFWRVGLARARPLLHQIIAPCPRAPSLPFSPLVIPHPSLSFSLCSPRSIAYSVHAASWLLVTDPPSE